MKHSFSLINSITILVTVALIAPQITSAEPKATDAPMTAEKTHIPKSVQTEHEEIYSTLVEAKNAPGKVGAAAKELAKVLHPHFVREEQIALPPLGLLASLAAGKQVPANVAAGTLSMADSLRSELPKMLEEHKAIRAAVEKLHLAARAEHATKYEQFAERLASHAQMEEEVLYPAAILVGEIIRGRSQKK